ncbi:hypothetical protein H6768_00635 [Candidatus Peribacteria bacterium]|nr:hypothetical protein [Candidatus Peribacteria bacterium]
MIKISEQDAREVLGDEAHTLIDGHREWTIQEDDAISPDPDADVRAGLLSIAHSLREKAQTMLQQQEEQIQREQIDQEYREARKEFAPLFDFIR